MTSVASQGPPTPRTGRVSHVNLPVEWHTPAASERPSSPAPLDSHPAEREWIGKPMDTTAFAKPLRHMQHRAFRRAYLGSHKRAWSWPTAGGLFAVACILNLVIYESTCHTGWWTPEGVEYEHKYYASSIVASLIFILFLGTISVCRTPLAAKLTANQAFLFFLIDLICLISLVVLAARESAELFIDTPVILRRMWTTLSDTVRALIVSPKDFSGNHIISGRADSTATLLGLKCSETQNKWFIWHWIISVPLGLQTLIILCDVFWSHLVGRIGAWYYLKSSIHVRGWRLNSIQTIRLLVPCTRLHETEKASTRFEIKKGLRVEIVATSLTSRVWRRLMSGCRSYQKAQHPSSLPPARLSAIRGDDHHYTCVYTGQVNETGLPHGFGYWRGDLVAGENLVGYWKNGVPAGPSKAREVSSGSGLMCVKLGWAKCLMHERRMEFGAAKVECSVSGRFFRGFPDAESEPAPNNARRDSGLLFGAIKTFERMVEGTKRVVRPGYCPDNPELDPPPLRPSKMRNPNSTLSYSVAESSVLSVPITETHEAISSGGLGEDERAASVGHPDGTMSNSHLPEPRQSKRFSWRKKTIDQGEEKRLQVLKEARTRQVSRMYRENIQWVLEELRPHTPAFGLQARSELIISVDRERGLDILGFVPEDQVVIDEESSSDHKSITRMSRVSSVATGPMMGSAMRTLQVKVLDRSVMNVGGEDHLPGLDVYMPELSVDGWIPMESIGLSEILVYVHGFNNSQRECQQTLGQMAAFGNFPTHLKILVFVWPAGTSIWHFFTAQHNAEDPICHEAFRQLLKGLQANGIRQIHVLVHSMGSRLFLKSMRNILENGDIFATFPNHNDAKAGIISSDIGGKIQLLSTTFMNPEYHLDEFVKYDYEPLRSVCANITIYADGNDRALWWSEQFSRKESLGRSVFGLRRGRPRESQAFLINPSSSSDDDDDNSPPTLRLMHTISLFQLEDTPQQETISSGKYWASTSAEPGEWMDLDIIDTTFMDRNINVVRHSFWNLNREIIEDLRELLVTRKRARQRGGRLDRRDGNVWVFRVAPSFLTSLFDANF